MDRSRAGPIRFAQYLLTNFSHFATNLILSEIAAKPVHGGGELSADGSGKRCAAFFTTLLPFFA
jgi:hypothetical protein